MSAESPVHGPPAMGAVARAQLRLIASRKPRGVRIALAIVLVQLVLVASAGILLGVQISSSHDGTTTVFWSRVSDFADELEFPFDEGVAAVAAVAVAAALWSFFWPYRVWGEEITVRRGYHWSMPVDRRRHDLLRTAVGLALLPPIVGLFLLVALATSALFGHTGTFSGYGALFWVDLLAAPLVIYLLTSVPMLGSRHPVAWLWCTIGSFAALVSAAHALGLRPLLVPLQELTVGRFGLLSTLGLPVVSEIAGWGAYPAGRWTMAWLGWLLVGAVGVLAAASRRDPKI